MQEQDVKRFICMSSVGVGTSREQTKCLGFLYRVFVVPVLLQNIFQDKEVQEKYIMESKLDWTIVRPGILTSGKEISSYRISYSEGKDIKSKISRVNVADFILKELFNNNYAHKAVSLTF